METADACAAILAKFLGFTTEREGAESRGNLQSEQREPFQVPRRQAVPGWPPPGPVSAPPPPPAHGPKLPFTEEGDELIDQLSGGGGPSSTVEDN